MDEISLLVILLICKYFTWHQFEKLKKNIPSKVSEHLEKKRTEKSNKNVNFIKAIQQICYKVKQIIMVKTKLILFLSLLLNTKKKLKEFHLLKPSLELLYINVIIGFLSTLSFSEFAHNKNRPIQTKKRKRF